LVDTLRARPPHTGWSERTFTILVVEDEMLVRAMLVDCLEGYGFAVFEAENATSAIQMVSYSGLSIDAVVTDIRMPGEVDGLGLMRWLCSSHPQIHVVVTSATCGEELEEAGGGKAYTFTKPYDCDAVAMKLAELLGGYRWGGPEVS
jgi:CheY-like chemotaxis protein